MSPNRRRRNIVSVHTIIISRGNRPRFAGKTVPGAAFLRLTPENVLGRAAAARIIIIVLYTARRITEYGIPRTPSYYYNIHYAYYI